MKDNLTKKVAVYGVMGAMALVLSFLEGLLPAFPFLPPGAKPGLANIVTMFAACTFSLPAALYIVFIKAFFAFLTRGVTAFFMSLCGGVLSAVTMYLLFKLSDKIGLIGISVLSALMHNLGQLIVSFFLVGSSAVFGYAPFLIVFGVVSGILTGIIFKVLLPAVNKSDIKTQKGG
ncbi:MAG: Gx transporter family protein [Ruminococcaceae bacterium]|nr:Gx transporter family protein [Oscillospiraceae bacterium]